MVLTDITELQHESAERSFSSFPLDILLVGGGTGDTNLIGTNEGRLSTRAAT